MDEELKVFMDLSDPAKVDTALVEHITAPAEKSPVEEALNLPVKPIVKKEVVPSETGDDFGTARAGLHRVLGMAETALADFAEIARSSESPRHYEVFNQMLKTTMEGYQDLLNLKKKNQEITGEAPSSGPGTVNNHLNIQMNAADLLDMMIKKVGTQKGKPPPALEILPPEDSGDDQEG